MTAAAAAAAEPSPVCVGPDLEGDSNGCRAFRSTSDSARARLPCVPLDLQPIAANVRQKVAAASASPDTVGDPALDV